MKGLHLILLVLTASAQLHLSSADKTKSSVLGGRPVVEPPQRRRRAGATLPVPRRLNNHGHGGTAATTGTGQGGKQRSGSVERSGGVKKTRSGSYNYPDQTIAPTTTSYDDDLYTDDDVASQITGGNGGGGGGGGGTGYNHYGGTGGKGKGKGGKGKGKGGKGKGKGGNPKGKKSKKNDDYYTDDFYPSVDDITFLDDQFFDDQFFEDGDCELVTFNETFAMPGPSLFLAPDTTVDNPGDPSLPGTVFIFESVNILEIDGVTPIDGSTVTGSCTRTTIGVDGGGICQLVFIDDQGFSVNVDGYLTGPLGGPMAITGGTGGLVGVIGDMDFFPIFSGNVTGGVGDIFLDTVRYEVIANLGLIVCP